MRYFLITILFLCCGLFAYAQKEKLTELSSKYSFNSAQANDVLKEEEGVKSLILKYAEATQEQKPAVKKEIEKKELAREEELIAKQKERIKRQEAQIKRLKQNLEAREKNKKQKVQSRVAYLISADSVDKVKNESNEKKLLDKVKSKAKQK